VTGDQPETDNRSRADRREGQRVRALLHGAATATLATVMAAPARAGDDGPAWPAGAPYASLVAPAPDMAGIPLLLLSDLAQHSRNLAADPRASLLVAGTAGCEVPLAGPRVTLFGRLCLDDGPEPRARYLRWQPQAARYAQLSDFRLYRLVPTGAHLVAGFGQVRWLPAAALQRDLADAGALLRREPDIVAHMNADHLDALADIAGALTGGPRPADGAWTLAGVDPEGADLARGPERCRLSFADRVADPDGCRRELVRATRQARKRTGN
jgi:putative heme iron utilization protein